MKPTPSRILGTSLAVLAVTLGTLFALEPAARGRPAESPPAARLAHAQDDDPPSAQIVGGLGGAVVSVAVSGTMAYAGFGHRLVPVDVSDPDHPREVGRASVLPGMVGQILLHGKVAYVAHSNGLSAVSLADPIRPCCGMDVAIANGAVRLAWARGHLFVTPAFARWSSNPIFVYDVGDPLKPRFLDFAMSFQNWSNATDLVATGQWLYVAVASNASNQHELRAYNITNPTHPTRFGSPRIDQYPSQLALAETGLYVAHGGGLQIFDVSDPEQPMPCGRLENAKGFFRIAAAGSRAVAWGEGSRVTVVDVPDCTQPRALGTGTVLTDTAGAALVGDRLWDAGRNRGLRAVRIRPDGALDVRATLPTLGGAHAVAADGRYRYVVFGTMLAIADADAPDGARVVGQVELPTAGRYLAVDRGRVFVLDADGGLQVVDVRDPTAPRVVGSLSVGPSAVGMALLPDGRPVVALRDGRLRVVDVSDSDRPRIDRDIAVDGGIFGLAMTNMLAVVATGATDGWFGDMLRVVDMTAGAEIGSFKMARSTYQTAMAAEGDTVFVAGRGGGFDAFGTASARLPRMRDADGGPRGAADRPAAPQSTPPPPPDRVLVVDISDPRQPIEVESWNTAGHVSAIRADADRVVVAYNYAQGGGYFDGVYGIDRRDGTSLFDHRAPSDIADLALAGDRLAVADHGAGLVEMSLPSVPAEVRTPTPTETLEPEDTATPTIVATATATATRTPRSGSTPTPTPTPAVGPRWRVWVPWAGGG